MSVSNDTLNRLANLIGTGAAVEMQGVLNGTALGAMTIPSGLTVTSGGVTVTAGGATVTAGGLTVAAGQTILRGGKNPIINQTLTTISTAGAGSYTAAQLIGGVIERDTNGGARTDTTDTAANIIAAIPGAAVGDTFTTTVINISALANAITLAGGNNVTLKGTTTTVAQNKTAWLEFIVTSSTTLTCYVSVSS